MCGRYASILSPEAIAALFRTVNQVPHVRPTWSLAPTQNTLVVRLHPETGERHLSVLNWGFLPDWTRGDAKRARRPINAEVETVATSAMFRDAFALRRALVPAAAVYEWRTIDDRNIKQPFAIARRDGKPLALAGVWTGWRGKLGEVLRSFAIITTDANQLMAHVHNRMPVIVEEADWPVWLGGCGR